MVALLGAMAGVGIMGVADHFSLNRSLWPTPICPHCGAHPGGQTWIPFIGVLVAWRVCPACGTTGGWRLALAVQALMVALAVLLLGKYGIGWILASAAIETVVLTTVAVIDMQHRLIPTLLIYPTILFALACSAFWPNLGLWNSLLGGALAFALFFALAFLARLLFGEGALGDGDVTLATLIGVICGYPMVVLSLALGALAGGLGALFLLALRRSPLGTTIPYGPYLVIGVIYVLLSGNTTHPVYAVI
jgi:leader peptidase (prepilin peptidase)/N-methyltransferase